MKKRYVYKAISGMFWNGAEWWMADLCSTTLQSHIDGCAGFVRPLPVSRRAKSLSRLTFCAAASISPASSEFCRVSRRALARDERPDDSFPHSREGDAACERPRGHEAPVAVLRGASRRIGCLTAARHIRALVGPAEEFE